MRVTAAIGMSCHRCASLWCLFLHGVAGCAPPLLLTAAAAPTAVFADRWLEHGCAGMDCIDRSIVLQK